MLVNSFLRDEARMRIFLGKRDYAAAAAWFRATEGDQEELNDLWFRFNSYERRCMKDDEDFDRWIQRSW